MRIKKIKLPSGFTTASGELVRSMEIRKLGGEEEDLLMDKEELKKGSATLFQVLKNCTLSMGSIQDPAKMVDMYNNRFLMSDLTYVLIALRSWGIDKNYSFEYQSPCCEVFQKYKIDLDTLRVIDQKEEHRGKERFIHELKDAPKPFGADETVPLEWRDWSYGDVVFEFRPLKMSDGALLDAIKQDYPKEKATRELYLNIVSYDGKSRDVLDIRTLRKMDSGTRSQMRAAIDDVSGGVDTEIIMHCKKCKRPFKDNLPVDVKSFFFRAADTEKIMTATSFREDGLTLTSWLSDSAGIPKSSDASQSKSDSSM